MYTTTNQIDEAVQTVFDKELFDLEHGTATRYITTQEGQRFISYSNADTLADLFAVIHKNTALSKHFTGVLQNHIEWDQECEVGPGRFHSITGLCFYTLISIGFIDLALESLVKRLLPANNIFGVIVDLFKEDQRSFTETQLATLHEGLQRLDVGINLAADKNALIADLLNKRYELLKKKIRTINVEINHDKKTVVEKIRILEMNPKYNRFLLELDRFIYREQADLVDQELVGKFRMFMEDFIHELAVTLAGEMNVNLPAETEEDRIMGALDFLNEPLGLSERDNIFICSFIDLLQAEGGQLFLSSPEFFRLIRNIAIEIALLLLLKYELISECSSVNAP